MDEKIEQERAASCHAQVCNAGRTLRPYASSQLRDVLVWHHPPSWYQDEQFRDKERDEIHSSPDLRPDESTKGEEFYRLWNREEKEYPPEDSVVTEIVPAACFAPAGYIMEPFKDQSCNARGKVRGLDPVVEQTSEHEDCVEQAYDR